MAKKETFFVARPIINQPASGLHLRQAKYLSETSAHRDQPKIDASVWPNRQKTIKQEKLNEQKNESY